MSLSIAERRVLAAGAIAGGWTFLAVLFTPQTYVVNQASPTPLSWPQAFLANAVFFGVWAALTPLVLHVGRRWPFGRERISTTLVVHGATAFAVAGLQILLVHYGNALLLAALGIANYSPPVPVLALVVGYGATNVMIYAGLIAVGHAVTFFQHYQDREYRLLEAQLRALRAQLHPHFLFNTLNALAELIYQDPPRAERLLTRLSELLRQVLARGAREEVPLAEELDFLRSYLEIQESLLQDRLRVEWVIADDAMEASVPALILQPLVENAVLHGIARSARGGRVRITARREHGTLRIGVEDDGVGLDQDAVGRSGIGLENTRARLQHLYGGKQSFGISAGLDGRGVRVCLAIPFERHLQEGGR